MGKPLSYDELVNSNFNVQDAMKKRDSSHPVGFETLKAATPVESINPDSYLEWEKAVTDIEKGKDTGLDTSAIIGDKLTTPFGIGDFTSGVLRSTESTISNVFMQTPFFLMSDILGGTDANKRAIKPIPPREEPLRSEELPGSDTALIADIGSAFIDAIRHPFLEESRNPVRPVDTVVTPEDSTQVRMAKKFAQFGFLVSAKDRMIQRSVEGEVQNKMMFDVGGVAASIARTFAYARLGGPKLAIGLMSGEVGSRKFVEQRAAGVSWVPSLVFSTTLGVAEGSLERISLGILSKKMRSATGVVLDSMISNSIEEALQSLAEAGLEGASGFEERGIGEVIHNALYEGMLGAIGGVGASPVVISSYKKIKGQFVKLGVEPKKADEITTKVFEQGVEVYMDELSRVLGVPRALLEQTSKIQADIKSKKKTSDQGFKEISDLISDQVQKEQTDQIIKESEGVLTPEETTELRRLADIDVVTSKIRRARGREIEKNLDLLEEKKKAIVKDLETRQKKNKPLTAVQKKLDQVNSDIEVLLDERDNVPEATVEELRKSDLSIKTEEIGQITKRVRAQQTREIKAQLKLEFKQAKDSKEDAQSALRRHIRARLGRKAVPAKLLKMIQDVRPGESLDKFVQAVDEIADAKILADLANQTSELLEKLNPKKIAGKHPKGPFKNLSKLEKLADKIIELTTTPVAEAQETIRKNAETIEQLMNEQGKEGKVSKDIGETIAGLQFESQMLADLAGFDMESGQFVGVSTQQAQKTVDKLKNLNKVVKGVIKLRRDTEKKERDKFIESVAKDIMSKGKGKNRGSVMSALKNLNEFSEAMSLSLPVRLKIINGSSDKFSAFQEELIKPLEQATLNYFNVMDFFSSKMRDNYAAYGVSSKADIIDINQQLLDEDNVPYEKKIVLIDGTTQKLRLTRNQIIQMYLYAYEDAAAAKRGEDSGDGWEILTGERQLNELMEKAENEGRAVTDEEFKSIKGNKLGAPTLLNIFTTMSQEDIAFANNLRVFYQQFYQFVNPTYQRVFGISLTQEQNYVPFAKQFKSRDITPAIDTVADVKDRFMSVPGTFKGRFKGNRSPFRLDVGALELAQTMITDQAHFVSYRPIMQKLVSTLAHPDVRRAINMVTNGKVATTGDLSNPTVTDGSTYKNLIKLTHIIMNNRRNTALIQNETLAWVNKQISVNLPGGKPLGYVKQVASSLASLDRISPKDFVGAINDLVFDKESVMAILNSSPTIRQRDRNMMQEIRDVFVDAKFNTMVKNHQYAKAMMYFIKKGNQTGVAIGGYAVYKGTLKKTGSVKQALAAMDQFVEETQQSASLTQTSLGQTGTARVLFKFISAQQQYYRQMRVALADYQSGRIGADELFRKIVVYQFVLPVMFRVLATLGLGGTPKEYIATAAVGSLTGIPVTGALLEAMMSAMISKEYWKGFQVFPLNILDQSVDNMAQLVHATLDRDSGKIWDEVIDIFQTIGSLSYVPIQGPEIAESLKATLDNEQGIRELVLTILGLTTTRSQKFIETLDNLN